MIAEVGTGRMFFPPDDETKPEKRDILHPETDVKAVLQEDGSPIAELMDMVPRFSYSEAETQLKFAGKKDALVFELKK